MEKMINYFKKPVPALAFGSTIIMTALNLLGITSLSTSTIFMPLTALSCIYGLMAVGILLLAGIASINNKIKSKRNGKG